MTLLGAFKAFLVAITAVVLAISGHPAPQEIANLASSTDAVVQEAVAVTPNPSQEDVKGAYDLGKAVGRLEAQAQPIKSQPASTTSENSPVPAPVAPQSPAPITNNEPATMAPQPQPAPAPEPPAPKSQARIEIVNPIPGKGLGREYVSAPEVKDESNYIEIGAVVFNDEGQPVRDAHVVVSVNGEKPITLEGTGVEFPYYVNGSKRVYPVYSFHYEFRDSGKVIIAFSTKGMRESVTLDVK